jgi:catechol 2,3-dioxygenase-like lactoylglutathione lyase family enzyme
MNVRNVRWIGVRTDRFEEMVTFFRDVLGLPTNFEEAATIEFSTSDGDQVQVMGPGDPYFDFFGEHATGPVPLFEVDDVSAAREELVVAGIEIVGPSGQDRHWDWIHVRAPDGNLYELASRRRS